MAKKYIVETPGKITIEILRQRKVQSLKSGVQSRRGLIGSRREEDYLPRRIMKRGNTNFYDLGQFLDGDVYSDRFIQADLDSDFSVLEEFVNSPLADDFADWIAKYKKIESSEILKYQIAVRINSGDRQRLTSGLSIPAPITRFALETFVPDDGDAVFYEKGGLFAVFDTANCKITDSPDFSSDAVDFELDANTPTDIFLNLAIFSVFEAVNNYFDESEEDGGERALSEEEGFWTINVYPEAPFANFEDAKEVLTTFTTTAEDDTFSSDIINWKRAVAIPNYTEDGAQDAADARGAGYLLSNHGASAVRRTRDAAITNHYEVQHTLPGGPLLYPFFRIFDGDMGAIGWHGYMEPLPIALIEPGGGVDTEAPITTWTHTLHYTDRAQAEGLLKAVFSQGDKRFYVWSFSIGG